MSGDLNLGQQLSPPHVRPSTAPEKDKSTAVSSGNNGVRAGIGANVAVLM